jgi:hypothetical protein
VVCVLGALRYCLLLCAGGGEVRLHARQRRGLNSSLLPQPQQLGCGLLHL